MTLNFVEKNYMQFYCGINTCMCTRMTKNRIPSCEKNVRRHTFESNTGKKRKTIRHRLKRASLQRSKITLIQLFSIFFYFEPLFNFRSNGINFGVMNNNITLKVRAEIERLIKSISNKQDALSHFYVKRELNSILCLPAVCYL